MSNLTNCNTTENTATAGATKSVIGRIHSFESCGTVDGPGIRFITFFQGCLMRCLYCHNRDTWDTHGGKEVTVEDLIYIVDFFQAGGDTNISLLGGEPFLHPDIVDYILYIIHRGMHLMPKSTKRHWEARIAWIGSTSRLPKRLWKN